MHLASPSLLASDEDLVYWLVFNYFRENPARGKDETDKYRDFSGPHFLIPFAHVKSYLTVSKKWREYTYSLIPCSLNLSCYGFVPKSLSHMKEWWPALQHFTCISKLKLIQSNSALPPSIFDAFFKFYGHKISNLHFVEYDFTSYPDHFQTMATETKRSLRALTVDCTVNRNLLLPFLSNSPNLERLRILTATATREQQQRVERHRYFAEIFAIVLQHPNIHSIRFKARYSNDLFHAVLDQVSVRRKRPLQVRIGRKMQGLYGEYWEKGDDYVDKAEIQRLEAYGVYVQIT